MNRKESPPPSAFLKTIILCTICAVTFFAYADIRHHQFLNFDDNEYVTENNHVKNGLSLSALRWAFTFTGVSYWHPLTWIYHMVDCEIFGLKPGYHLMVNLAIHILNSLLLFLCLMRMTGSLYKAALVALFFAVHPVNLESVSWITERKTLLSTFFLMTAMYAYVHYTENKNKWLYGLALCLYVFGLLSKPSILTFPVLLLILDCWPLQRFKKSTSPDPEGTLFFVNPVHTLVSLSKSSTGWIIIEKIPFFILSLASYLLSMLSLSRFHIVITYGLIPLDQRISNLFVSICRYLWNMLWPVELSIFYPFPKVIPLWHFLGSLLFVLFVTAVCILGRKKNPWRIAGWLLFLAALSPASGLIQAGLWPAMANRFMYIPMIGIFILLAWEFDTRLRGRYSHLLKAILTVVAVVYFTSLTRVQNIYYSNSYALFTRASEITKDNFIAYNNIGESLASLNRMGEAGIFFEKAMALNPTYDDAIYNYGLYLAKKDDPLNASVHFSRVIEINPRYRDAYINLAIIQYHRGDKNEAEKLLLKALALDPDDGNAHNNLGLIRALQGNSDEAIRHYKLAVKNKPSLVQARVNLSKAYEKAGLYREAIAEYGLLGTMMPDNKALISYRIAGLHALQGNFRDCERTLETALTQGLDVFTDIESDERFNDFRKSTCYAHFLENKKTIILKKD
jgi:protein O-mannosyl-transferase